MVSHNILIVALVLCLVPAITAQEIAVTLAWNPNPERTVGYRIHYGTESGNYTHHIDAGSSTTTTISNLAGGAVYFFAATAYNASGGESSTSNEVSFSAPGPAPTPTPSWDPGGTRSPTPAPFLSPAPTPTPFLPTPTPAPSPEWTRPPTPSPIPSPFFAEPGGLANISTRLFVRPGDDVMIGAFIITGEMPKTVLLRAIGPSLADFEIGSAMADPMLQLVDSTGTVIASNDNWQSKPQTIEGTDLAPSDDHEAALLTTLLPGAYSVIVRDSEDQPGVALFDMYDLGPAASQLANVSTRGKVEYQDQAMIGGFMIGGDRPVEIIVRAMGPSLAEIGIAEALDDPTLELRDADGRLVAFNDDWRSDQEEKILDSGMAPADDLEAAIVATLVPGSYSAIVLGTEGSKGVALFEVYQLTR